MNAPQSESKKYTALELAHYFNDQSSSDIDMTDADLNRLAELLLACHKAGYEGQRMNYRWSARAVDSVVFKDPPFNVSWPITDNQTIPTEEK